MAVLNLLARARATVLTLAILLPATTWAQSGGLEYAVKANYLYKFGPFVEWPASVFANASSPFNVCILGDDPFGAALDDAVRGQTVAGHPVAVRRLRLASNNPDCHVLYLGRSKPQKTLEVLRLLRGAPVLTVTDEQQGVSGGIVHFVLRDGRVRFEIDAVAAQANGLGLSSKLLALAIPRTKGGG
jgi:hypothetical protein